MSPANCCPGCKAVFPYGGDHSCPGYTFSQPRHPPVVRAILEALVYATPEDTVGSIKVYIGGTTMYLRAACDLARALDEPLTLHPASATPRGRE